jgi:hypothetical protein
MMMRTRCLLWSVLVASGALLSLVVACGSSDSSPAPATGGSGAAAGAAGKAGSGGSQAGSGGSQAGSGGTAGTGATAGGAGSAGDGSVGDGNDTLETASPIKVSDSTNDIIDAALDPVATDVDWYKFDGTAGQVINIITAAKPDTDPYNETYLDLVIALFDAQKVQIASQDDGNPPTGNDPLLMTQLPATGTYYIRVLECNAWDKGGPTVCSPADTITHNKYSIQVSEDKFNQAGEVKETEPNDTEAQATALTYAPTKTAGVYYMTTVFGTFADATDVDVYSFKFPADLKIDTGARPNASFYRQVGGKDGNGSSTEAGEMLIQTPGATIPIAKIDSSNGSELSVPVEINKDYLLLVKRAATPTGTNDFYFTMHTAGSGNTLEATESGNDTAAGAEVLTVSKNDPGAYYVEGDILSPADKDHFSTAVPATNGNVVSVVCGAQRSGSGLRNLTFDLLKADGSVISGSNMVESATKDALLEEFAVPTGETKLILRIGSDSVDSTVSGKFYRCAVRYSAPSS